MNKGIHQLCSVPLVHLTLVAVSAVQLSAHPKPTQKRLHLLASCGNQTLNIVKRLTNPRATNCTNVWRSRPLPSSLNRRYVLIDAHICGSDMITRPSPIKGRINVNSETTRSATLIAWQLINTSLLLTLTIKILS